MIDYAKLYILRAIGVRGNKTYSESANIYKPIPREYESFLH